MGRVTKVAGNTEQEASNMQHFGPQAYISEFVASVVAAKEIAARLVDTGAYKVLLGTPTQNWPTWKMGVEAPVYCNCRHLLGFPDAREAVSQAMESSVRAHSAQADAIAGIANAGTPWSTYLADRLGLPLLYVTGEPKGHGLGGQVHGDLRNARAILLVDDLVASGGSVLKAKTAIERETGGTVIGIQSIVNWGFASMRDAFIDLPFRALTSYPYILVEALLAGQIDEEELLRLLDFYANPAAGFPKDAGRRERPGEHRVCRQPPVSVQGSLSVDSGCVRVDS